MLLIHEICHAFSLRHGPPWLRRLRKAVARAKELGRNRLADLLESEAREYEAAPVIRAKDVYRQLADWTAEAPDKPYRNLSAAVAYDVGMTLAEFDEAYPRARRVHDAALRLALAMERHRKDFLIRMRENGLSG